MSEESEHQSVCRYIKLQYPQTIFTSDASGIKLTIGQAKKMKHLKSSRGIPDILIFEPKGRYHGLCIEMKATGTVVYKQNGELRKNEHLEEQSDILEGLRIRGYNAVFAIGRDDAIELIDNYMKL